MARMDLRAWAAFILVCLIWGSTWIVITWQIAHVAPAWSVTYRFALGAVWLFTFCLITKRKLRYDLRQHGFLLAVGAAQFMLNFNFVYSSERYVTSGLVAVAYALLIVPNAFLAWVFLKQRVTWQLVGGAALGIVGVLLLFLNELQTGFGAQVGFGMVLVVCGILCASTANVLQASQMARSFDIFGMLAWAMLYGAIMDTGFALATVGAPQWDWGLPFVGGLLYLSFFGSALAFAIYFDMIRQVGPARAAYSSIVVPFIAMAISTYAENYQWTGMAIGGALLTMCGLYIALKKPRAA